MDSSERAKRFRMAREDLNINGKESKRAVSLATGIPSSALVDYENPDCARMPNSVKAEKLAAHYGVNVAWLLGQSDSWKTDTDIQTVCDTVGLTPEAVHVLQDIMKDDVKKELVNMFITSEEFYRTIILLHSLKKQKEKKELEPGVDYASLLHTFEGEPDLTVSERDASELRVWQASQEMTQFIRKMTK